MKPMLALEKDEDATKMLLTDDGWWLEQKLDGDRLLVRIDHGTITYLNRDGKPRSKSVPPGVPAFFQIDDGVWFFDGELIDDVFWVFDLLIEDVLDADSTYSERRRLLEGLFGTWDDSPSVRLLPTSRTSGEKHALLRAVTESNGEGWVLKHHSLRYLAGTRSNKMLKLKRTRTIDCMIGRTNMDGKENAELILRDPATGKPTPVGKCSLLGKPPVQLGDVVEVKFLYVGANGRLYQPRLMKVRDDKDAFDCTTDQLDHCHVNKTVITADNLVPIP